MAPRRVSNVRNVTGNDATLTTRLKREHGARPALPGESRFWCSCDVNREHPFYRAAISCGTSWNPALLPCVTAMLSERLAA